MFEHEKHETQSILPPSTDNSICEVSTLCLFDSRVQILCFNGSYQLSSLALHSKFMQSHTRGSEPNSNNCAVHICFFSRFFCRRPYLIVYTRCRQKMWERAYTVKCCSELESITMDFCDLYLSSQRCLL